MANEVIVNHATLAINTNFMLIFIVLSVRHKDTTKRQKTQTSLFLVEANTKVIVYVCKWVPWFINDNNYNNTKNKSKSESLSGKNTHHRKLDTQTNEITSKWCEYEAVFLGAAHSTQDYIIYIQMHIVHEFGVLAIYIMRTTCRFQVCARTITHLHTLSNKYMPEWSVQCNIHKIQKNQAWIYILTT